MANMSYCRWENTIRDLRDCARLLEHTLKPGTRLNPLSSVGHWEGVLRDGSGRVVWACGHLHKCRDQNSRIHGKAARRCAEEALRLLKTE